MVTALESFRHTFVNQNSLPSEFTCTFRFGTRDFINSHDTHSDYESQIIKVKEFLIVFAQFLQIHNLEITAIFDPEEIRWFFKIEYIGFRRYALGITLNMIEIKMRSKPELLILAESYAHHSVRQFREAMADYPQQWTVNTSTKQLIVQNPCARVVLEIVEIRFIDPEYTGSSIELVLQYNSCLNMLNEKLWYKRLLPLQCNKLFGFPLQRGYFYVVQPNAREIIRDGAEYIIDTRSEEFRVRESESYCFNTPYERDSNRQQFYERAMRTLYNGNAPLAANNVPKHIGDITCTNNARSEFLRCAINPCGPCESCKDYTNNKQ